MYIHGGHRNRMMKKLKCAGIKSFENHEKLEILLYSVFARQDTNPLARDLLERFGSLREVINAGYDDFLAIDGFGESSAETFALIAEFLQYLNEKMPRRDLSYTSARAASFFHTIHEFVHGDLAVAIFLDGRLHVESFISMSTDELLHNWQVKRMLSDKALNFKCDNVIIVHNTNGEPIPTDDDGLAAESISNHLSLLGVGLIDYVIIGKEQLFSFRDEGIINVKISINEKGGNKNEGFYFGTDKY